MQKTVAIQVAEAYKSGYEAAQAELPLAMQAIERLEQSKEMELAVHIRAYMVALLKEALK
jgi:hypothetical protein